jgi:hypothetical protein
VSGSCHNLSTADKLQVGEHPAYSGYISLVNGSCLGKAPTTIGVFVFEQVAFESLPAHDFTSAASAKTLRCCFAAFEFWHFFSMFRHNLSLYSIAAANSYL